MEEHKKDPPSREEPGSQEDSLGREPVEPGSKPPHPPPPQSPTVAPKDLESDFVTPRKRGKRRLSSDSSNSEGESLDSRTPLKMTRVGEDVMVDTATTPPASPTDTIIPAATSGRNNVGKKSPQPADKPKAAPTVQTANPAPKLRQDYPSRKAGKRDFRSQPDGNSRRKQFQPSTRAPAFVDFPVVIHDLGGGSARFDKLGPWHRSQLLSNAVGAVRSIRPLPSGKWLIGCATKAQQSKLAHLDKLPGGTPIGARIPRPVVEGVVGPIPMGGDELKLVKQDLEAGGHRVAGSSDSTTASRSPLLPSRFPWKLRSCPLRYGSVPHRSRCRLLPHLWDGAPSVRPLGTPNSSADQNRPAAPSAEKVHTLTTNATRRSSPAWIVMAATRRPTRAAPRCRFAKGRICWGARLTFLITSPCRGSATKSNQRLRPLHSLPPPQWTTAGRETGQHRPRSLRTPELRCRTRG